MKCGRAHAQLRGNSEWSHSDSMYHNFSGPEVGQSHWVHGEKGPAEVPSPAEEVQSATGAAETVLLCHHWIHPLHFNNWLVQSSYQMWPQKTTEGIRTAERIIVQPSPLSKNCTHPEWAKELVKSLYTPHIQHTYSVNGYRLIDATELWAPERPDTEPVSSLRQSISWTLDIKHGAHNTIIQLIIHQT